MLIAKSVTLEPGDYGVNIFDGVVIDQPMKARIQMTGSYIRLSLDPEATFDPDAVVLSQPVLPGGNPTEFTVYPGDVIYAAAHGLTGLPDPAPVLFVSYFLYAE